MFLAEAFSTLDQLYESPLVEGRKMPYALIVLLDGEWRVYRGLETELTEEELAEFLLYRPEYDDAIVILSSDIPEYIHHRSGLTEDAWQSREELIAELTNLGYKYKFEKYTSAQLYNILKKNRAKIEANKALAELEQNGPTPKPTCDICNSFLADSGICPRCYDGADDLDEGIFDNKASNLTGWKPMNNIVSQTMPPKTSHVSSPSTTNNTASSAKKIVTIFYDTKARKLRARADDGVNGVANVAFPNHLRGQAGQQYVVDDLVWNGKNYRVTGSIKPVNSVATTQNINENNKETNKMNFQTVLEELDRLYEELPAEATAKKADEEEVVESLVEDAEEVIEDDEEVLIDGEPIVDDEATEDTDEPKQIVLACSKCGALVIKDEAAIEVDESTDLINVEEECQYCEKAEGYTIVGAIMPYELAAEAPEEEIAEEEIVEEGLFGKEVEKTIKASEVKRGDKIVAFDGDKLSKPCKVTEVKVSADTVNITHKDGNVGGGVDTPVTVLTKE